MAPHFMSKLNFSHLMSSKWTIQIFSGPDVYRYRNMWGKITKIKLYVKRNAMIMGKTDGSHERRECRIFIRSTYRFLLEGRNVGLKLDRSALFTLLLGRTRDLEKLPASGDVDDWEDTCTVSFWGITMRLIRIEPDIGDLKGFTEALCSAEEQALRTNYSPH